MYRSILVSLDGSTFAEHALPIAWSIVRRAGATLHLALVHVPVSTRYVNGTIIFDEELEVRNKERERGYLDEVVNRLRASSDITVTSALLDELRAIPDILNRYAETVGADLMVMATHGRGALTRFWLGSVADELIRRMSIPILLVRPQEGAETAPDLTLERGFQHMLIPLDGSALSEQILEHAVTLGKLMQTDYTLLQVIEPVIPASYLRTDYAVGVEQQLLGQLQAEAQSYLEGMAERLRAQSLQVHTKVILNQYPATAILEDTGKNGIDLIAMETHGRGGLSRLLVGSVADKVLRGASVPVLLHRPQGEFS